MCKGNFTEHTKWRVADSHWTCIYRSLVTNKEVTCTEYCSNLVDYLWMLGFDIPESITYCLAQNDNYKLKYRVAGGLIDIFVSPINK